VNTAGARDTMQRRLSRMLAALLFLLLVVGVTGVVSLLTATKDINSLAKVYGPANDANNAALRYMLDAETSVRGYLLTRDRSFLQPYLAGHTQILPSIQRVGTVLHGENIHRFDPALANEQSLARRWLTEVGDPIATSSSPALGAAAQRAGKQIFDRFRVANGSVGDRLQSTRAGLRDHSLQVRDVSVVVTIAAFVLAVAISAFLGVRTARRITHPLSVLWETVRRFAEGDFSARADPGAGPVEIRDLATAVNLLGDQSQRAARDVEDAEHLRARMRPVASAVRAADDPHAAARTAVQGLGETLGVDRVRLQVFADERIVDVTTQWNRPGLEPAPEATPSEFATGKAAADALWRSATLLLVDDESSYSTDDPELGALLADADGRAFLVAALGEGTSAFGLLALASSAPRNWTPAEAGLVQHIASELGHAMLQTTTLTRQRAAIEELHALEAAKNAFIAVVSHELRTPLTSISGYLELVLDGDGGPIADEARGMLEIADRNTVRLRTLIEDLLTQSRIEAGRMQLSLERTRLADVLHNVCATMTPLAQAATVTLRMDGDGGDVVIDADRRQLDQALTNVVANGIKFTPAGGSVTIGAQPVNVADGEQAVLVRIVDTGIGIPPDEIHKLFDRFFRASNATSAAIPGTGLGLSIVREIIERHGGALEVRSALDQGTTIEMRLPVATASPAAPVAPVRPGPVG
jgi:signal transduction histidine kinase